MDVKALAVLIVFCLLAAACGGDSEPTTSATATTTTTTTPATTSTTPTTVPALTTTSTTAAPEPEARPFAIYALGPTASGEAGPFLIPVTRLSEGEELITPQRALEALFDGFSDVELEMGLSTAVPEGSRLLAVDLEGETATVDVSAEFAAGEGSLPLAQVVYTATRFFDVDAVHLLIEGEPVTGFLAEDPLTRDDFIEQRPLIFVEDPTWGAVVDVPFIVAGLASVFEATVEYELVDPDGNVLSEGFATASEGGPGWGVFVVELNPDLAEVAVGATFDGILVVWETSAETGERQWVMEYPLVFAALR